MLLSIKVWLHNLVSHALETRFRNLPITRDTNEQDHGDNYIMLLFSKADTLKITIKTHSTPRAVFILCMCHGGKDPLSLDLELHTMSVG
jgi:hypothetical protein